MSKKKIVLLSASMLSIISLNFTAVGETGANWVDSKTIESVENNAGSVALSSDTWGQQGWRTLRGIVNSGDGPAYTPFVAGETRVIYYRLDHGSRGNSNESVSVNYGFDHESLEFDYSGPASDFSWEWYAATNGTPGFSGSRDGDCNLDDFDPNVAAPYLISYGNSLDQRIDTGYNHQPPGDSQHFCLVITANANVENNFNRTLDLIHTVKSVTNDGRFVPEAWTSTERIPDAPAEFSVANSQETMSTSWSVNSNLPNGLEIMLPIADYDQVAIDWGDGTIETVSNDRPRHRYSSAGDYEVKVMGKVGAIDSGSSNTLLTNGNRGLVSFDQWPSGVTSAENAFVGAYNLEYVATPPETITNMAFMFLGASNFNQNLNSWDTSNVTTMRAMFENASDFNNELGSWDVSNVEDMGWMFAGANSFNRNINDWDTSSVTNMSFMLSGTSFNRSLTNWDTSNVTNMRAMFENTAGFNGDIRPWDVSSVEDMGWMFAGANSFNRGIGGWDTSSVNNMSAMFSNASNFNQNIGNWNTSNVTNMAWMFEWAYSFNQDISRWDVSNVTNRDGIFNGANSFDESRNSPNFP